VTRAPPIRARFEPLHPSTVNPTVLSCFDATSKVWPWLLRPRMPGGSGDEWPTMHSTPTLGFALEVWKRGPEGKDRVQGVSWAFEI
jgi:hypothetical protein